MNVLLKQIPQALHLSQPHASQGEMVNNRMLYIMLYGTFKSTVVFNFIFLYLQA